MLILTGPWSFTDKTARKHRRWRDSAPGLTARSVLKKFAAIQMVDVHIPTNDGRTLILSRYTQPRPDLQPLLARLKLQLPAQPLSRITAGPGPRRPF